ncbi:MAG: AbrB/MazE/SpoVT family DNA-binding domain-containing protein [Candidatus Jordarchaeum sp.]|uniref:AbrB/MazE/SpoVT family DNA-binding domain-containing protein n=1 Tax=Candidatus Jordarchaeum sp. TaxID=2823881 RepID=UPI00404AE2B5
MLKKQTRKLVKWGSSNTLIISLPREWAKRNKLSSDQEVSIMEHSDGSLLILPPAVELEQSVLTATVDSQKYPTKEFLDQIIQTKYLSGHDLINITSKQAFTQKRYQEITQITQNLLGFEITSKTPNQISLQDVMSIQQTNLTLLIRIITRTTLELLENIIQALQENDTALAEAIIQSRDNIYKYHMRILRQLRKALQYPALLTQMELTAQDTLDYTTYVTTTNDIAENIETMSRAILKQPHPPKNKHHQATIEIIKQTLQLIQQATGAFLFHKVQDAIDTLNAIYQIKELKRETEIQIDKETNMPGVITLQIILDAIDKIAEAARPIAQAALRQSL